LGLTRRIIFPTIRILLWAVIAVALVKIAFAGADVSLADDTLTPGAQISEAHATAAAGTITNTIAIKASVVADAAVPVKATLAGTVTRLVAADGQHVDAGAAVLVISLETPVDPTVTTNPDTGEQTTTEHPPTVKKVTVTAPVAGTLSLPTLKDQLVSVGDAVATINPGTLSVTGTLTADQQYRLLGAPTEAAVTLKGGPAPFTCTGLRVGATAPGTPTTPTDPGVGTGSGGAGTSAGAGVVTCAIPAGVTAFAGLGADISITNGDVKDATVIPVTAVQGTFQSGNVWVVTPDGGSEERPVTLGLTDGENIQVVGGLAVGDVILQYVPVVSTDGSDCGSVDFGAGLPVPAGCAG